MSQPQLAVSEQTVFMKPSEPVLVGDTLATMSSGQDRRRMSFVRLSSKAKVLSKKSWTVDLSFDGWSVAIHPPTNVMAVSEHTGSTANANVHILSMNTGKPHTFAQFSTLKPQFHADFVEFSGSYMSISQNTVAILFYGPDRQDTTTKVDELFVWDWRTGSVVYSQMNTAYQAMILVNNTCLVAGYATDSPLPGFALELIDLSGKPIKQTNLVLNIPPSYSSDGHFCGLHSGETLLYDPSPTKLLSQHPFSPGSSEVIITAQINSSNVETKEIAIYCVTLRLCELLELAKQGGDIPWEEWKGHAFPWGKVFAKDIFSDFRVSGWRLVGPLEEVSPDILETEIHEFCPWRGPHVSTSDEASFAGTGPAALTDSEPKEKKEGKRGKNVTNKLSPPNLVTVEFSAQVMAGFWTNVTVVEDDLIIFTFDPSKEDGHTTSVPFSDIYAYASREIVDDFPC